MTILSLRLGLKAGGYAPIPVNGKRPPMAGWSGLSGASDDDIRAWDKAYPYAASTGILTALVPVLDIDITRKPAAEAVEALTRERFEEAGFLLVRIGMPPKRAVLFRCDQPFKKISVELISPEGGSGQKLEFLGDGQQVVCFGDHEQTRRPCYWHGGEPGQIKREDLPHIHEDQARQLINDAADLLCRDFGYRRAPERPGGAARNSRRTLGAPRRCRWRTYA
jgi:Bifunctional DNA primase/polymerase, N-terminal